MRVFNTEDKEVHALLKDLEEHKTVNAYRKAFYNIGRKLSVILNHKLNDNPNHVALACASEDADWLAKGIIDGLKCPVDLCVYWSQRFNFGKSINGDDLEYAEIEKAYEEISDMSKILIVTKSIISSSCVIRSQIMRLISRHDFEKIYIASPVMYKDANTNLRNEFPETIYNLFDFIYFAIDDEKDEKGWVIPGIGGSVYANLDIEPRHYYPQILESKIY